MQARRVITVVGCHAEGEVGDVITGGVLPPAGTTMLEKKLTQEREHDHIRRLLIQEPRGSVARHVNLIVPPTRADCVAGAIVMEPTEYPPMSGSNTMCIVTVLLETGIVAMTEPVTHLRLDMPAGPVDVTATCDRGKVTGVTIRNVPAMALKLDCPLEIAGHGTLKIDISYGGMIFAIVDAKAAGFEVRPDEARDLAILGEKVRIAAREQHPVGASAASGNQRCLDCPVCRSVQWRRSGLPQYLYRCTRPLRSLADRHRHLRPHGSAARARIAESRRGHRARIDHRFALQGSYSRRNHRRWRQGDRT